ncbi:SDR family oxidoreductase [Telluribacter humicola]|uniref:SDR family oxidoreductase n=1 Tax=Telluribacter humicola TaxID=1720261 RepID=UPI001A978DC6|nr:SDR family NAD(P)-dependent oxidoreductase [Telluribacter humicola]
MNLAGNTILITGGASGIGLALAERLLKAGSEVIICGRREDKLNEAQQKHPGLHIRVCDVAQESERISLISWVSQAFPKLNVVINNAGIQKRTQLTDTQEEWAKHQQEIAINLEAPIHLSLLFIPLLRKQPNPVIINITSGLAFAPAAFAPIYSATKAALHSFTLSLRHQLQPTGIKVVEIAPPAVNTDLGGPGLHTFGAPLDDFADAVIQRLQAGELEIGYGTSEMVRKASRAELDEAFNRINNR